MNEPAPENLIDLIEYQKGSVVSRTILNRKSGSITIFAFDAGEGLSEHTTPHDAQVQLLEGELLVTISNQDYSLHPGQIINMPANKPHKIHAPHRCKMLLTMLKST